MSLFNDLMMLAYQATCIMFGLDYSQYPQSIKPLNYADSPAGLKTPNDNLAFYIVQFGDEQINRQIDDLTDYNSNPAYTTKRIQYVQNLIINWQTYGDDGFGNSGIIRRKLFDPDIQEMFKAFSSVKTVGTTTTTYGGISLITDIPGPVYVPEAIGTQWYKRYDLYVKFNQLVTEISTVPAVSGTEITIETEKGVVDTCSVLVQS